MRANLSTRVDRLEVQRTGPSDTQMSEEGDKFLKKMQDIADRFTEADRDMSPEDYDKKMSIVMRAAWKVRFLGADFQTEMCEYEKRKDSDLDARLLHWRIR